ncbi:hypothetical protein ACIBSW_21130 [Actinoplanes sp. NPDC049668]|uniref:hypothetical protein n=1 Tax=unclassified Actinoplanes TaxID=2626549 RepID=UPI0033BCBF6A
MTGTEDTAASESSDAETSVPAPASPEPEQTETAPPEAADPGTADPDEATPDPAEPEPEAAAPESEPEAAADEPQSEAPADEAETVPEPDEAQPEAAADEVETAPKADRADEDLPEADDAADELEPGADDLPVPAAGPGLGGWIRQVAAILAGSAAPLALVALLAGLSTYYLIVRSWDVLTTLVGGFGVIILPLWALAYIVLAPIPLMICLAGTVGFESARAAAGTRPGAVVWRSIAARLGALWLWLAACFIVMMTPSMLLSFSGVVHDRATELAIDVATDLLSTLVLTVAGLAGCVVLAEPGQGLRRAWRLLSPAAAAGLTVATLAMVVLPGLVTLIRPVAFVAVTTCCDVLWAVAALATYAQGRHQDEQAADQEQHDEPAMSPA